MQGEPSPIQIALTPRFQRDLRELAKISQFVAISTFNRATTNWSNSRR